MATIKIGDADNIKIGSQNGLRVMLGTEQVWPLNITWQIVGTITIHYVAADSSTISSIKAAGENTSYAYATANVEEYHGPNLHHVIANATLTPAVIVDSNNLFYIDSSNATRIRSHSLGTNPNFQQTGPTATVSFVYNTSSPVDATVQQQTNVPVADSSREVTTNYTFTLSTSQMFHAGGQVSLSTSVQTYNVVTHYTWTSTATSESVTTTGATRTHAPDTITVTPSAQSIAADNMSFTLPTNNTQSDINYAVRATLDGQGSDAYVVTVKAIQYTYRNLQIVSYAYNEIPAAGTGSGGVYPNPIQISLRYSIDNVEQPNALSGYATNGATSVTLTDGSHSVTATVQYLRQESGYYYADPNNGYVTATSRRNNIDSDHTTATVSYPYRKIQVSAGGQSNSATTTVYQQRNQKTRTSRTLYSYAIELSAEAISYQETTVEIIAGTATFQDIYSWTSGYPNSTEYPTSFAYPSQIWTDPSVPSGNINVTNHTVKIPANTSASRKDYLIYGQYTYGGVSESGYAELAQAGLTYSFANPSITNYAYAKIDGGETYNIPASGNRYNPIYPSFHVDQTYGEGTATSGAGTISFNVSGGTTSGTVTSGGVTYSYTVAYYVNNSAASPGVEVASRGTTDDGSDEDITVRSNCYAIVTINLKSGQSSKVSVKQQANRGTPYSAYDRYDETYINRFVVLGTTATRIPQAKDTTVTVEVMAKWEHFFAGVEYTSGEHTGGGSEYHDEIVTPSYLDVDGAAGGYGVTSFTASNKHVESTKTYTVSAIYGGKESSDRTIDQAADYKVTGQTRNYTADISISGDLWAGGGEATITSYATHEEFSKWNSDNTEVSGSATTEYDVATVFTKSGTSSRFDLGSGTMRSDGGYDYIVTHDDMMNNAATDALVVQAKNGSNQSVTSSELRRTITNSPSSSAVYGSYYADGSAYYGNYRVDDFSVDDYDSSSSKAPSSGGSVRYSVSASHDRLRKYSRDAYYYFDSNWGSQHGGVDHNDAGHRNTVSKADSEIRVLQTYPNDSVTFSTSDSWLTVNTSTGYVIIGAQSQGGEARYGQVFAKNSGDTSSGPGYAVGIYQYGYASISTNAAGGVTFPAGGGSVNIKIYSANTTWSISYGPPDISMPSLSFVPSSGGDMDDDDMETTVKITAGRNDRPAFLMGTVTIVPDAPGLSSVTFRVSQASLASS